MKSFFKWLLIAVVAVAVIVVLGGFLIPQQWTVTREITIAAPAEAIYVQVANLRNWQRWAPWNMEKDKTQVYTYEGPAMGVGAKWLWTSEKMGQGYLLINKAEPRLGIVYELFIDMNNMQSTMKGVMDFKEHGENTIVTWTDHGDSGTNLVKRWMSLLIGKMLGDEMEDGLKKLKALVEKQKTEANNVPEVDEDEDDDEDGVEEA
jgi:hypothetical protein